MAPIMSDPPLPRRTESGMATRAVNAAAGVLLAAMKQGRQTPTGLAITLDSACLLNSPETAAELAHLRAENPELKRQLESARVDGARLIQAEQRRAELEAVLDTHRKDDQVEIKRLRERVTDLEAELYTEQAQHRTTLEQRNAHAQELLRLRPQAAALQRQLVAKDRPVDEDPIAYALTEKADGITSRIAPTQALQLEDPHDSPLHHTYTVGRDLPEVTL